MLYKYQTYINGELCNFVSSFKSNPHRSRRYREQSMRQQRPKWYTATVNGRQIMQRLPRNEQLQVQPC